MGGFGGGSSWSTWLACVETSETAVFRGENGGKSGTDLFLSNFYILRSLTPACPVCGMLSLQHISLLINRLRRCVPVRMGNVCGFGGVGKDIDQIPAMGRIRED